MDEANTLDSADQRIVFRVGLHLGDLIVDGDDLYGDGVNIAGRLEGKHRRAALLCRARA